jgi:hypothetical protein
VARRKRFRFGEDETPAKGERALGNQQRLEAFERTGTKCKTEGCSGYPSKLAWSPELDHSSLVVIGLRFLFEAASP